MRRGQIDRAVLEVDDDPVEPAIGHDLHGLDARNGRDRAEGGAAFAPFRKDESEGVAGAAGSSLFGNSIPCSAARAAENRRVEREAATRDSNDLQQNSKFPTPEKFPGTCELPKKTAVADDGS